MRAMLERRLMARSEPKFFWGGARKKVALTLILIAGCAADEAEVNEADLCFERYIEEFGDQYPLETLKKTAALKCYS